MFAPTAARSPLSRFRTLAVSGLLLATVAGGLAPGSAFAQIDGCWTSEPARELGFPQWSEAPQQVIDTAKAYTATVETNLGTMVFALDAEAAPITVNSFVCLATSDYYNFTLFHRIIANFMIQGGDPTATGTMGPGYEIADELPTGELPYKRGTLAMANAGPNTGGSQFFVVHQDQAEQFPSNYTIFGQLTEGEEVLDAIASSPVGQSQRGEQSAPIRTVGIVSITIQVDGEPLGA
jgi:cyclophilin family peptidyl-prolyl cis-trans isomerase